MRIIMNEEQREAYMIVAIATEKDIPHIKEMFEYFNSLMYAQSKRESKWKTIIGYMIEYFYLNNNLNSKYEYIVKPYLCYRNSIYKKIILNPKYTKNICPKCKSEDIIVLSIKKDKVILQCKKCGYISDNLQEFDEVEEDE